MGPVTAREATTPPALLGMSGISKAYGRIRVLDGVDLMLAPGEVHALLGENGAGKSTLMKVMFGIVTPDAGRIDIAGLGPVRVQGPRHALSLGIGLVSQELSLVPQLDVAQNVFLGQTPAAGLVPRRHHRATAGDILRRLAPHVAVDTPVSALGMADRQLVEIARTLARGGRVIAFDEPTSSLTPNERDALFAVIRGLKAEDKAIIYISHRMDEIRAISDHFTVLRDGRVVASGAMATRTDTELNALIAGRELARALDNRPTPLGSAPVPPAIATRGLSTARLAGIDLAVRPGEILGLAGLVGSGRSAILRAIFGIDAHTGGEVLVGGAPVALTSPVDAMRAGIALIPEDRRGHAVVPMMSIEQNFGLASQRRFARFGLLRRPARREALARHVADLGIRPATIHTPLGNLSGGNQQKVVIARWLATGARVLMFDEPTRGIDIGAKAEIYALLRKLAQEGAAIILVSSELPELLLLSHRIAVVTRGRLALTLDNDRDLTEERLMRHAGGAA